MSSLPPKNLGTQTLTNPGPNHRGHVTETKRDRADWSDTIIPVTWTNGQQTDGKGSRQCLPAVPRVSRHHGGWTIDGIGVEQIVWSAADSETELHRIEGRLRDHYQEHRAGLDRLETVPRL